MFSWIRYFFQLSELLIEIDFFPRVANEAFSAQLGITLQERLLITFFSVEIITLVCNRLS